MSKDFSYLRHWITGEGYGPDFEPRPVVLECVVSRSGMSMTVYDRGQRLYSINGYGFDRLGCALAGFLEACFQPELHELPQEPPLRGLANYGLPSKRYTLNGAVGVEAMIKVADAIGLKVHVTESKAGVLIIISKKGN